MAPTSNSSLLPALPLSLPFPFTHDNWTGWGEREGGEGGAGRGDVVQGSLLVVIAVLGAGLNVFLLLAILPNPRMRSVRQVLLVHLAVVGLVASLVLTLPAGILQLVTALSPVSASSSSSSSWQSALHPPLPVSSSSSSSSLLHSVAEEQNHAVLPSPFPSPSQQGSSSGSDGGGGDLGDSNSAVPGFDSNSPGFEPPERREEEEGDVFDVVHRGPLCTMVGTSGVLLTAASVWTVAALAWDKHRAIANPLHHPLVAHKSTMAAWLAVLWTLAAALAMPPVFGGGDLRFVPALSRCGMHAGGSRGRWHALLVVLVGIVAPLSLMLYCYTHIFRIARAQSSRIAATMLRMVTLIQAPIAPPPARNAGLVRLRGTRAMATIVQLVGSCVASYVPWAVLLCHQAVTDVTPSGLPAATAAILLHAAPLTAATVYGVRNRNLRASFARFVSRRIQHWCRPHRRRPSVKSLRNSSSAVTRKQAAQNGLSPSMSAGGMRRTFSLQSPARRGQGLGLGHGQGQGRGLHPEEASDALLPRPRSCNVLPSSAAAVVGGGSHNHTLLALPDLNNTLLTLPDVMERHHSQLHDVIEMNSEFPAIELELDSEFAGVLERETVT